MIPITFNNYMNSTEAIFKGCKIPKRPPDYVSESGSRYWQQKNNRGEYVIRQSNHWVNKKLIGDNYIKKDCDSIASCMWHLKTTQWNYDITSGCYIGKCYLKDFKSIS